MEDAVLTADPSCEDKEFPSSPSLVIQACPSHESVSVLMPYRLEDLSRIIVEAATKEEAQMVGVSTSGKHQREDAVTRREKERTHSIQVTRNLMRTDTAVPGGRRAANRYGTTGTLPEFIHGRHVPFVALINPMSGARAGEDIMGIAKQMPYYQDRFFNIIEVVKSRSFRGGMLDVFRIELNKARYEAEAMGTRPRLISGGGDGTASFALNIVFLALKADPELGLIDTGNGFTWTDQELKDSFPALAQMPLGSANDFGHILGWGQKYPGDPAASWNPFASRAWSLEELNKWMAALVDPKSRVVNFDVWGIMPPKGQEECDFKIAELSGSRGRCPKDKDGDLVLKQAGNPSPFLVCLYFSVGFGGYLVSRFQINRRGGPKANDLEYLRQGAGIVLETIPPQLCQRLDGCEIDCDGRHYFPPRPEEGTCAHAYREVGFMNINWQAKRIHAYERAPLSERLVPFRKRDPVKFNDGSLDMFRMRMRSCIKNPGVANMQCDRRKDMHLTFKGPKGKGVFFQWDGEARYAFHPDGAPFSIYIRQALCVPVVIGPDASQNSLRGDLDNGKPVRFEFCGDTPEDRDAVRRRMLKSVNGDLIDELRATSADLDFAGYCGPIASMA
jgi:hypothetical protein